MQVQYKTRHTGPSSPVAPCGTIHVQETNLGLDMNGTHQVLAYADDVNLIGDDIRTIERNADVLLNACKDIGLAVNTGKTKYMEIGRHRGMTENAQDR